ncbi:MAG: YebC/PmpR family DNA-binding transcriptional regulator [Patescibacteria group bacterium]
MSGHSKWAQIKRQKGAEDSKRSKLFGKLGSLIAAESRKTKGDVDAPGLRAVIEKAKKENMPKDTIERAVKKGAGGDVNAMEALTYEGYGPGGCALIIEAFTGNRNKAAQEIKHIIAKNGGSLAAQGAAVWAFKKTEEGWEPNSTIPLSDEDGATLSVLIEELEENDEVQDVYTNAE